MQACFYRWSKSDAGSQKQKVELREVFEPFQGLRFTVFAHLL